MKKLLLPIITFWAFSIFAATPDDAGHHDMLQYLRLIPDTLYFNQDYLIETSVSATAPLSATLEDYTISANDRGIDIMIPWTNREQDKKLFQLYKGEGASRTLIAEKRVVIIQKLNDNVGYDDDLFMIDDRQISLHDNVSIQTWEKAGSFNLNAGRFSAHGLKVSGFVVSDVTSGQTIENAGSTIRQETKAFISAMGPGAQIHISGIKAVYTDHGLPVMLDLNYTPVLTLAPEM